MAKKTIALFCILCVCIGLFFAFEQRGAEFVESVSVSAEKGLPQAESGEEPTSAIKESKESLVPIESGFVKLELPSVPLVTRAVAITETINEITERMKVLAVAQPRDDVTVDAAGFNIFGTSHPEKDLYVNGRPVTNRVREGFFNVFVSLSLGENVFVFSQEGQTDVTIRITREAAAVELPYEVMESVRITSAFPAQAEYVSAGDTIIFEAVAPIGATVMAEFDGEILTLTPRHRSANSNSGQIYATTFSASYTIGAKYDAIGIVDLGRPLYSMEYNGQSMSISGSIIRLISDNTPFYATVIQDSAWVFPGASLVGGPEWSVVRGQRALVRGVSGDGDWVRLDTGMWIQSVNVSLTVEPQILPNTLSNGRYVSGGFRDSIKWDALHNPAARVAFDGNVLKIYFAMQEDVPEIDLSSVDEQDTFFSRKTSGIHNGVPYYAFTIRGGVNVEGFYTSFENGEFALNIRRRRTLAEGDYPLRGFTFVIDAGHGGRDPGALGPMGAYISEKDINLINSIKLAKQLEELGAAVVLTRSTDVFITLQERTDISRRIKPDMFISMHADSTVETRDATHIHGASFWYRNPNSRPLAEHFTNELHYINPRTTRTQAPNHANFFVCRPTWTPSVIVEASFMNNIHDFAWMINEDNQQILVDGIINAVLSYYYNVR